MRVGARLSRQVWEVAHISTLALSRQKSSRLQAVKPLWGPPTGVKPPLGSKSQPTHTH